MRGILTSSLPVRRGRVPSPRSRPRLEVLEDRFALSWGGVPPRTIVPPANPVKVTLNSQRYAEGAAAVTADEVDYYAFTAPATGTYRLGALTPDGDLDTVLGVFSATGNRLAHNDDVSSFDHDSQLSVNLRAGARYFFGVTNFTGTPGGGYTWKVDGAPADDSYENNDSRTRAANLGTLTTTRAVNRLVMADGNDYFRFRTVRTGTAASSVSVTFAHARGNLGLALYNAAGVRLASSNRIANVERISLYGRPAGTYFVRVFGVNGARNPSYSLRVTPTGAAAGVFHVQVAFGGGLTAAQQAAFTQAAARWERIITGDLPTATYQGRLVDDVLIEASGQYIDGRGGVLGQAGPDEFRSGTLLPYHGAMEFDTADLAAMQANGSLVDVITHEMGHVLGLGTIWRARGLVAGAGTSNPVFIGRNAVAAYNQLFRTRAAGVPVENTGGRGTRDSHWRESRFGAEMMTGYVNSGRNPISRVTAASLLDLGYQVNLSASESYLAGSGTRAGSSGSGTEGMPAALRAAEFASEPVFGPPDAFGGRGEDPGAFGFLVTGPFGRREEEEAIRLAADEMFTTGLGWWPPGFPDCQVGHLVADRKDGKLAAPGTKET